MPTRLITDKLLHDDRVNRAACGGWFNEVLYRRLLSLADDHGRYDGRATLIRAHGFSLLLDVVSEALIETGLVACEEAGLIVRYTTGGKPYVQIVEFGQKPRSKSKYPGPDDSQEPLPKPSIPKVSWSEKGGFAGVDEKRMQEWAKDFPGVQLKDEMQKAHEWLMQNKRKRKKDVYRFLCNWFKRTAQSNAKNQTFKRPTQADMKSSTPSALTAAGLSVEALYLKLVEYEAEYAGERYTRVDIRFVKDPATVIIGGKTLSPGEFGAIRLVKRGAP